ncbi:hypothetical protein Sme01_70650 [Sphaerisporangium melleum]|uniref:Uncharacterized protein n=1 Tax=Sphaerisporangium melleum TaxID=321316 RepID=A0A917RML0_9ACTN|nr:hypothetical protein GCM10007964_65140 [Sphaerisporangium melleum]GII74589.1 hypothetical protein Sme01_70650 [Sphaerisporangium melleum]
MVGSGLPRPSPPGEDGGAIGALVVRGSGGRGERHGPPYPRPADGAPQKPQSSGTALANFPFPEKQAGPAREAGRGTSRRPPPVPARRCAHGNEGAYWKEASSMEKPSVPDAVST